MGSKKNAAESLNWSCLFFLFIANFTQAQFTIKGQVTDTNYSPLVGVEVVLLPGGNSYASNTQGIFEIGNLQANFIGPG